MVKVKKGKKRKEKKKLTAKQKQNRQIMWAIVLMASVIIIILVVPYLVKNYFNEFEYLKLDFAKTQLGEIIFYSTEIPTVNAQQEVSGVYTMNFRSDPRKSDEIEIDILNNIIGFEKNKTVYITFNPGMQTCEDTALSFMNLANFLRSFGGMEVSSGVINKNEAELYNLTYVTCETHPDNTVLWVNGGERNIIRKSGKNCYELIYNECDVIPVTEKFMLIIIEGYMKYFTKEDESFWKKFIGN